MNEKRYYYALQQEQQKKPPQVANASSQVVNATTALGRRPSHAWTCGVDTPQQELLRDLILHRHVLASYTPEEPKNEKVLSGMLVPYLTTSGGATTIQYEDLGKHDAIRSDRKYAAILPCCGTTSSVMMKWDHVSDHGMLQGMHLLVYPNLTGLTLWLDQDNVTDQLFHCHDIHVWKCVFSEEWAFVYDWMVLEAPRNVSSISMCNHASTCGTATATTLSLQSLTVYGDDGVNKAV
jgi:hypothetical protein